MDEAEAVEAVVEIVTEDDVVAADPMDVTEPAGDTEVEDMPGRPSSVAAAKSETFCVFVELLK